MSKIVAAVGTAQGRGQDPSDVLRALEEAEVMAVKTALAEGISIEDSETLLARKREARAAVRVSLES